MQVLIAEDDPVSRRILQSVLARWDFQPIAVEDGAEAWQVMQQPNPPRLVILDWNMPQIDGLEVCRLLRAQEGTEYSYIILLSARGARQDMIDGMGAGADDYITKPFDPDELKLRLRAARRILQLQADLLHAQESLRQQATHDDLTGLWNRRAILDVLDRELARAGREQRSLAVMLVDVDHFKNVNDTYGHHTGDIVLRQLADRMGAMLRPYDLVGRYGGEEFMAILPGCEFTFTRDVAERLRKTVADQPMVIGDIDIELTVSLGVAAKNTPTQGDADTLIRLADEALYLAKGAGRNCVRTIDDVGAVTTTDIS